jgi:cullin-associated NEDD8-dissociated protein 1
MKVKANSVKQEYEKQDELKRSAMRAVAALLTISDAGMNQQHFLISVNHPLMFSLV